MDCLFANSLRFCFSPGKRLCCCFKDSLENLSDRTESELLKIHFSSILEVIHSKANLTRTDSNSIRSIYNAFFVNPTSCDLTELSTYTSRCKSLIISWVSPTDAAVSYTWFDLPKNWNPENEYPLYVYLHGLWDVADDKLRYLANPYSSSADSTANVVAFEDGYHIAPWGRGNLWYQGISETDIFECIARIESLFKVNQKRKYIGGHSMGGFGAWYISSRSVDIWAGVGIHAGALWYGGGYTPNSHFALRNTPVYFVCGDKDGLIVYSEYSYQTLHNIGNKNLKYVTFPGGHDYWQRDVDGFYLWIRNFEKQEDSVMNFYGQNAPTDSVEVFAAGIVSKNSRNEYAPRFSPSGKDFYYTVEEENRSRLISYSSQLDSGVWSPEDTAFFCKTFENSGETYLQNDTVIYFTQITGTPGNLKTDFWKAEKGNSEEWDEPFSLGAPVNDPDRQWLISVSNNNNIVYSGDQDAFVCETNGVNSYLDPFQLQFPTRENDHIYDIYIDPGENYLIYSAETPESQGKDFIYFFQ
ncbi:MAG: hypothetical protein HC906_16515 [Bacteroidales bacterium]|nr:hypothetical protein [Bacteroidales bacterium]